MLIDLCVQLTPQFDGALLAHYSLLMEEITNIYFFPLLARLVYYNVCANQEVKSN